MSDSSTEHLTITEYSTRGFHYYCTCGYETDSAQCLRAHVRNSRDIIKQLKGRLP